MKMKMENRLRTIHQKLQMKERKRRRKLKRGMMKSKINLTCHLV